MIKLIINFILHFFNLKVERFCTFKNPNLVICNFKKKKIIKFKIGSHSRYLTRNEIDGYKWFYEKINSNNKLRINNFLFFSGLETDFTNGKKVNYLDKFSLNLIYIKKFIKFYELIWKDKKKLIPSHGDLTFDNIIITKKKFQIIDWEFFNKKGEVYGFDLVYLFLSTIILPTLNNEFISNKEKNKILKIWKLIRKKIKNKKLKKNPLKFMLNRFKNNSHWKKINSIYPNKFFLNKLKIEDLRYFEELLK